MAGGQISGAFTITGLTGFKDASGIIHITNRGYTSVDGLLTGNAASWDKVAGKIVFEVADGRQLAAGKLYIFSVTLTNPDFARTSPGIQLELAGAPSANLKPIDMDKALRSNAPLHIDEPNFSVLRIGQRLSAAGALNELTITFKPNLDLSKGYRFTIEGLTGSGTSDTAALPITGCDGVFSNQPSDGTENLGRWSQSSGTLELYTAQAIANARTVVCSFSLINPSQPQSAATVSITVSSFGNGQVSNVIGPRTFRNAPEMSSPFMIPPATFLIAKIGQSSPYPGVNDNRITVSLKSNVAIGSAGGIVSSLTLAGLTGSETADSKSLPLSGERFVADVVSTAAWIQGAGTLVVTIPDAKSMEADHLYTFSFSLANPRSEQKSPSVSISTNGGLSVNIMPMSSDTKGCIHTGGDTAPLFIYPRGFLRKDIGIRASWPQASNILSVTLQSSTAISSLSTSQSSISITGLKFATKFDSVLPMTSSHPGLFGTSVEWNAVAPSSDEGLLILNILPGQTLIAGTEYQVDIPLKNGATETSWKPFISVSGLGTIGASEMAYKGEDLPVLATLTTTDSQSDVGMTISFTSRQKVSKADSIVIQLPGFGGSSTEAGHQIWGVTSEPPAFSIEPDSDAYADSIAGGDAVAQGKYRVGSSSRTQFPASQTHGAIGSTILLNSHDNSIFEKDNVYSGMQISIAGSDSYHSIYQQESSTPNNPAVAHFYPKYPHGSAVSSHVGAGAAYTILSQIELTAKEDICAGTKVIITIPQGSGITTPGSGVGKDTKIMLSQVKFGFAKASVGSLDTVSSAGEEFVGIQGRRIPVTLEDSLDSDYDGLPWAPMHIGTTNFVFVDGFRTMSDLDPVQKTATLFTGYGSIKKTNIRDSAAFNIKGARLDHSKNINADSHDIWLTLSKNASEGASSIRPALKRGSYLQLGDEILRFTGDQASGVKTITLPQAVGEGCELDGTECNAGQTCATITFTGCSDNPSLSVVFEGGKVTSFSTLYRGACTDAEKAGLTGILTLSAGATCTTDPFCGTGCKFSEAWASNDVINMKRGQFSSPLSALTCPCTNWLIPSSVYLENGGLSTLQYSTSVSELNLANKQSVKIGYSEIADTVVAGDHVISIGLPQMVGANCRKEVGGVTKTCNIGDTCAKILFSGCSVNPEASLNFGDGAITAVALSGSADERYGQSICHSGQTLVGVIVLEAGVNCDVAPACGSGCSGALDADKDTLIIKHRSAVTDQPHSSGEDVLRVHSTERIGYQIALVPPTLCTLKDPKTFLPGQCASAPKAGTVLSWIDPSTGGTLASMYATADGLEALCLDLELGGQIIYPSACSISCDNRTADGGLIASKPINITLKFLQDLDDSKNLTVVLSMPITFNTAYNASSRRDAPQGFEYRLNGDCKCPSSAGSTVTCNINKTGTFQAKLIEVDKCSQKPAKGGADTVLLVVVLGGVAGLFVALLACYLYDKSCRMPPEKEADGECNQRDLEADNAYEGPVFVGRPVPLTPTIQPYSVMPAANVSPVPIITPAQPLNPIFIQGASPALMPEPATWNNSNSFFMSSLPPTLTPARQAGRSPGFDTSSGRGAYHYGGERSSSPVRRQENGERRHESGELGSPRQHLPASVSPEDRPTRLTRMPYGV